MKQTHIPAALVLVLALAFMAAPAFTPPFTGYAPGQLPVPIDRFFIQPAGYAFAIWGPIYLWLIGHAGFGLWQRPTQGAWARVRPALAGALALGTIWLAIATHWPLAATATIAAMAALAILAFVQADPAQDKWWLSAPLAMFAGWLTAATLASAGIILVGYGLMSNTAASLALLALATALGLAIQKAKPRMPLYGATVTWALVAIAVANRSGEPTLAAAAATAAATVALGTLWLNRRPAPSMR